MPSPTLRRPLIWPPEACLLPRSAGGSGSRAGPSSIGQRAVLRAEARVATGRPIGTPHPSSLDPSAYAYLLGLYLGDGYIALHPRGVYRLRVTLDSKYPGIVAECAAAMQQVLPASKVGHFLRPSHDEEVNAYSKAWPCLFPQHGPGKTHEREIELAPWQEDMVRGQ